jgi:hypothetical protein
MYTRLLTADKAGHPRQRAQWPPTVYEHDEQHCTAQRYGFKTQSMAVENMETAVGTCCSMLPTGTQPPTFASLRYWSSRVKKVAAELSVGVRT